MTGPLSVEDVLAKQKAEKEAAAKVCSVSCHSFTTAANVRSTL